MYTILFTKLRLQQLTYQLLGFDQTLDMILTILKLENGGNEGVVLRYKHNRQLEVIIRHGFWTITIYVLWYTTGAFFCYFLESFQKIALCLRIICLNVGLRLL